MGRNLPSQDEMSPVGLMKPAGPRNYSTDRFQYSIIVAWRAAVGLGGFPGVKAATGCGALIVARRWRASSAGDVR
jgi:hypothetical protein